MLKCNHWIRNTDQISYSSLSNCVIEATSYPPSTRLIFNHLPWKPGTQESSRLIEILIQRNVVDSNWMLSGDSCSSLSFRNTRNTCSSYCRSRCSDIHQSPQFHLLWSCRHSPLIRNSTTSVYSSHVAKPIQKNISARLKRRNLSGCPTPCFRMKRNKKGLRDSLSFCTNDQLTGKIKCTVL